MATDKKGDELLLTFASPSAVLYKDTKVKQVDVPTYSGTMGILVNHVPMLAVVKPGVVTVFEEDGNAKKYFLAAGALTVNEDSSLVLLASEAVSLEDLDLNEAQKNLAAASSDSSAEGKIKAEVNQAILDSVR